MIKSTLTLLFFFLSFFGFGQSIFIEIDKNSKAVNDSFYSYSEIAKELTKNIPLKKKRPEQSISGLPTISDMIWI